jgi:hypothetical protein
MEWNPRELIYNNYLSVIAYFSETLMCFAVFSEHTFPGLFLSLVGFLSCYLTHHALLEYLLFLSYLLSFSNSALLVYLLYSFQHTDLNK